MYNALMEISFICYLCYWNRCQKTLELHCRIKSSKQQSYEDDRVKAFFDFGIK